MGAGFAEIYRFKPALNSKGLRLSYALNIRSTRKLQASPEFKGIKTAISIQTKIHCIGFKPALNSKGLRPWTFSDSGRFFGASSQP